MLYSLLPILRNTVTGLHGVHPAVVEAPRGLGMTPGQRLRQVELPLALPVMVAGIRTATLWTAGMATHSTPVGAPSLGNYVFGGLQTRNTAAILTEGRMIQRRESRGERYYRPIDPADAIWCDDSRAA